VLRYRYQRLLDAPVTADAIDDAACVRHARMQFAWWRVRKKSPAGSGACRGHHLISRAALNEANKAQTAKDSSEQFYTDLRWSMSAWLLQQRFDTHDKTSLGAPNRRFAIPQADWHLSLGVGHNEYLLHHRCGGRDHSRRRFLGSAIGKAASLARWRSLQDATRARGIQTPSINERILPESSHHLR
jgi:hypothetical protein